MRKVLLFGALFLGSVVPGCSQFVSFGLKAGLPLNDAVNGISSGPGLVTTDTERWLLGPTGEIHLPFRLSFEVDALYRRESYAVTSGVTGNYSIDNWQFPFLGKYELHGGLLRPFVDAGVTYRHLSGGSMIRNPNNAGFTIGGGLALKLLFLRFAPEIRYTRWGSSNVLDGVYATQSQNQADFLVGFSF